jgi:hypothetical protein
MSQVYVQKKLNGEAGIFVTSIFGINRADVCEIPQLKISRVCLIVLKVEKS